MDFVSALDYRDSFTNLYLAAFPPEERRDADAVFDMARSRPEFACHALRLDGAFAGLLTAWHLEGFDYVEHFAVEPHLRGRNLGGDAIDAFVALHDRPVVLEVEPPHAGEMARRRIGFYERHGFELCRLPYVQPPYSPALPPVELRLMATGGILPAMFGHVCRRLRADVYGVSD